MCVKRTFAHGAYPLSCFTCVMPQMCDAAITNVWCRYRSCALQLICGCNCVQSTGNSPAMQACDMFAIRGSPRNGSGIQIDVAPKSTYD